MGRALCLPVCFQKRGRLTLVGRLFCPVSQFPNVWGLFPENTKHFRHVRSKGYVEVGEMESPAGDLKMNAALGRGSEVDASQRKGEIDGHRK